MMSGTQLPEQQVPRKQAPDEPSRILATWDRPLEFGAGEQERSARVIRRKDRQEGQVRKSAHNPAETYSAVNKKVASHAKPVASTSKPRDLDARASRLNLSDLELNRDQILYPRHPPPPQSRDRSSVVRSWTIKNGTSAIVSNETTSSRD